VVSDKPGFAAMTAIGLRGMKPVGLAEDAFAKAPNLAAAIRAILEDKECLDSLVEVRLGDSDPQRKMPTSAAITYVVGNRQMTSQYVPKDALSIFAKGKETSFDRRTLGQFSIVTETTLVPRLFRRVVRELETVRLGSN
jgi:hypothetical protein